MKCIDDEIPFEIPQGWEWCRINKVIRLISGRDLEPSQYNDTQLGIPYITGASNFHNENLVINRWTSFPVTISHKGELLITCKGTIGDMAFNTIGDIHIARQIMSIDSDYINLNYLKIYLEVYVTELQKAAKSIIPGISRGDLLTALIPIPPFNEQIRIYNFIDNLIPKVVLYGEKQRALEMLNDNIMSLLRKSILQEAIQGRLMPQNSNDEPASVLLGRIRREKERLLKEGKLKKKDIVDSVIFKGDDNKYYEQIGLETIDITDNIPFEIPHNWEWCRLRDICNIFTGATFKKEEANAGKQEIRVLRGGNILPFEIALKADDIFLTKDKVKDNILLKENDVITPAVTSLENIGKMARVEYDMNDTTVGGFVFVLRPHYNNTQLSKYLLSFMSSPSAIEYMKSITNKSGQAFYNIGKERLALALLPIPPIVEQQRIVSMIETIFDRIKA